MIQLHDRVVLKSSKIDARTGYLIADATFSRVGIQEYMAWELGLRDREPSAIVRIYRSPEEVGKPESLETLQSIPTTDDHPSEDVTAANWRKLATGWTGDKVTFDGKLNHGKVVLTDAEAIKKWNAGKKELSVGYACDVVMTPGTTPEGEPYDGYQINIVGNHMAQVDAGRCGAECRIGDGKMCADCAGKQNAASCNCHKDENMSTGTPPTLVTRTVDGISIQTTDQGAQVIDKLLADLNKARTETSTAQEALKTATADHQKAIEAKDGEIAGLNAKIPDAAALDAMASERANTIADCRVILGDGYEFQGKTSAQMMADAVSKVLGEEAVKDKSADFLSGVFATLKKSGGANDAKGNGGFAHILSDGFSPANNSNNNQQQSRAKDGEVRGRDAYLAKLRTPAHMRKQA